MPHRRVISHDGLVDSNRAQQVAQSAESRCAVGWRPVLEERCLLDDCDMRSDAVFDFSAGVTGHGQLQDPRRCQRTAERSTVN